MIFHHGALRKMSQLRESCWILRVTVGRHNETMVWKRQWMTITMDDIAQKVVRENLEELPPYAHYMP